MAAQPTEREGEDQVSTGTGQNQTGETARLSAVQSRRKRGGFHHTQSTANNIYFRNPVHVLEGINQSDTTLGQAPFRRGSDQSSLGNGKNARGRDDRLPDYNDPPRSKSRHLHDLVGRPRSGTSNAGHFQPETDLVIFTWPSITSTLKPAGTQLFATSVVFSCSQ